MDSSRRQWIQTLKNSLAANGFVRNVGWLTASMLVSRVLRLAITVVVARTFTTIDYGQIALIFTAHEIIALFIQRCTQVKLIQAPGQELASLCRTTYTLNWFLGLGLLAAQCLTGYVIASAYDAPGLWLPIATLGICHLILPLGMVPAALNVRQGKLNLVAKIEVAQTFFETIGVLSLLALGAGIWALVIPKLLAPVIWVYGHRSQNKWQYDRRQLGTSRLAIFRYSANLVAVDGLQVVRQNLDYLLIGHFLGLEALGLYFFSFNAGLGIATTFANAINSAFLPHLCNADGEDSQQHRDAKYRAGIRMIAGFVGMVVVMQAAAAPLYVPLIFGANWAEAGSIPLIVMLCLTAFPKTLFEASSQYLRALNRPQLDLRCHFWLTIGLAAAMVVAVPIGLNAIAFATLATYGLGALVMLLLCRKLASTSPLPTPVIA